MIELKNITKTYKSKKGNTTEALKGIDLKLGEKGITFILGKSGSGKSTLLNILGGLDTPTTGEIIIGNKSSKDFKESDYDAYRNTYMGFVFQEYNLIDSYNIKDNIKLPLELQGKKATDDEVSAVLKKVGLEGFEKRKTNELSGGQRQRVAIARAIIKNPKVILADEPTGNLDSETSAQIFELLKVISKDSLVVIVSHDTESANNYADRIIKIVDGKIKEDTKPLKGVTSESVEIKKSKFPFKYSFKMGIGNLFHKKIKVLFTFLALIVCLLSLGVTTSILNYDVSDEVINQFEKNGPTEVRIVKYNEVVEWSKYVSNIINGTGEPVETLDDIFPKQLYLDEDFIQEANNKTNTLWAPHYNINSGDVKSIDVKDKTKYVYYDLAKSLTFSDSKYLEEKSLVGKKASNKNEIVVSSYIADIIMEVGIKAKNKLVGYTEEYVYKPTSYDEIVNDKKYVYINGLGFLKISGIYKVETNKYEILKTLTEDYLYDLMPNDKNYEEYNSLNNSFHYENSFSRIYLHEDLINDYKNTKNNLATLIGNELFEYNGATRYYFEEDASIAKLQGDFTIYDDNGKTNSEILEDEVIVNTKMLNLLTSGDYKEKLNNFLKNNKGKKESDYISIYLKNNEILKEKFISNVYGNKVYVSEENYKEYKIKGVVLDKEELVVAYFNEKNINELILPVVTLDFLYKRVDNVNELKDILKVYPIDGSDAVSESQYSGDLLVLIFALTIIKGIGKYITIVFAGVSLIMLVNFISNSIKFRKKEIGILRALGCKGIDLTSMFIYECLTLVLISFVVACTFIPGINNALNSAIKTLSFMPYDIMKFGLVNLLYLGIMCIGITLVVSILPMIKVTRQKPIDTILDK